MGAPVCGGGRTFAAHLRYASDGGQADGAGGRFGSGRGVLSFWRSLVSDRS